MLLCRTSSRTRKQIPSLSQKRHDVPYVVQKQETWSRSAAAYYLGFRGLSFRDQSVVCISEGSTFLAAYGFSDTGGEMSLFLILVAVTANPYPQDCSGLGNRASIALARFSGLGTRSSCCMPFRRITSAAWGTRRTV